MNECLTCRSSLLFVVRNWSKANLAALSTSRSALREASNFRCCLAVGPPCDSLCSALCSAICSIRTSQGHASTVLMSLQHLGRGCHWHRLQRQVARLDQMPQIFHRVCPGTIWHLCVHNRGHTLSLRGRSKPGSLRAKFSSRIGLHLRSHFYRRCAALSVRIFSSLRCAFCLSPRSM
eukprot:SAG31_NODE_847_length_11532_cov_2.297560_4_plen_177_part_00